MSLRLVAVLCPLCCLSLPLLQPQLAQCYTGSSEEWALTYRVLSQVPVRVWRCSWSQWEHHTPSCLFMHLCTPCLHPWAFNLNTIPKELHLPIFPIPKHSGLILLWINTRVSCCAPTVKLKDVSGGFLEHLRKWFKNAGKDPSPGKLKLRLLICLRSDLSFFDWLENAHGSPFLYSSEKVKLVTQSSRS